MLRFNFPSTEAAAAIYGGHMQDKNRFFKFFDANKPLKDVLTEVNLFLKENDYETIKYKNVPHLDYSYEKFPVSLSPHGYTENFVLFIQRDDFAVSQTEFITNNLLDDFTNNNSIQIDNPKDLSIKLNNAGNNLLEHFSNVGQTHIDEDLIKNNLANVFSYAFLLADNFKFDVETLIFENLKLNK